MVKMKRVREILVCLCLAALVVLGYLAPVIASIVAVFCLCVWVYSYGKTHGWGPALLKFLKEIVFGW